MDISKSFRFEAAHRLPNHEGQCSRIHGHSYRVDVMIHGSPNDMDGSSSQGMVMDFADLKTFWKDEIEQHFDHRFFIWKDDPLLDLFVDPPMVADLGIEIVDEPPTAEYLARVLFGNFLRWLQAMHPSVMLGAVRVWETESSWALQEMQQGLFIMPPKPDLELEEEVEELVN